MRTSPPSWRSRSSFASRKPRNWAAALARKSVRSSPASPAISPSRSLRVMADGRRSFLRPALVCVVVQIGAHPLAQEHRMCALEHPLAGAVPDGGSVGVLLEPVDGRIVGQLQEDHVVEVPPESDVVPAHEADPELLLMTPDLARE